MLHQRFTERARQVMAKANLEVHATGAPEIDPTHLLVAILKTPDSVAAAILSKVNIDLESLNHIAGRQWSLLKFPKPLTQVTKAVVEASVNAAVERKDDYVGTEHLLLGLVAVDFPPLQSIWSSAHLDATRIHVLIDEHRSSMTINSPAERATTRAPEPVGAYPYVRRAGGLLFISGVGPRQRGSKDIPGVTLDASGSMTSYDIEAQVRAVMQNLRWILEENGSSWEKLVDITSFLTDMQRDFAIYNRVYAEYFPPGPNQPCRTTLGITALPQAGNAPIAFEVKAIAAL